MSQPKLQGINRLNDLGRLDNPSFVGGGESRAVKSHLSNLVGMCSEASSYSTAAAKISAQAKPSAAEKIV